MAVDLLPALDPVIGHTAAASVGALLLTGALAKLRDMALFRATLDNYRLLHEAALGAAAVALPLAELAAGALLLPTASRAAGTGLALLLLVLVTGAVAWRLARGGGAIDCGCGGSTEVPLSRGLIARNAVLMLLTLLAALPALDRPTVWLDALATVLATLLVLGLYPDRQPLAGPPPQADRTEERSMTDALVISNLVLWVAVLALLVAVIALSRQIGILYERIAPMGALMMDTGPKVGEVAPVFDLPSLGGGQVAVGAPGPRATLLFFLSPTCPVCKKLLPVLQSIHAAESRHLDLVFASDGEMPEHAEFRQRAGLGAFPYVLSAELGMSWRISKLPYAVLIDERGIVRGKGLVNSREQIESLLTARDLGLVSVQDYMDRKIAKEIA